MCFALQDPVSWSDVASFDMSETATPPRHNQAGFTTLLQERTVYNPMDYSVSTHSAISGHDRNCAPFGVGGVTALTPINSSKQTSTGKKRRRERREPSPLGDRTCSSFLDNIPNSPKKTPTKSLPFTPSRVHETFFFSSSHNSHLTCVDIALIMYLLFHVCVYSSAVYQGQII